MGSKERRKGHDYERRLVKLFKKAGFPEAKTSRYASKFHDDNLIDLVGIPFHVQAKAVVGSVAYIKILSDMKTNIKEKAIEVKPCLIFHKKGRTEVEELVIMTASDFWELLKQQKEAE